MSKTAIDRAALGIAGWSVLTLLVVVADLGSAVRVVFVVPFALVAVGAGWAGALGGDKWTAAALTFAISIATSMFVAQVMALTGAWSVTAGVGILAVVALAGAAYWLMSAGRWPRTSRRRPLGRRR